MKMADSENLTARQVNPYFQSIGSAEITDSKRISELSSRPEVKIGDLLTYVPRGTFQKYELPVDIDEKVLESVDITIKYRGYIDRERQMADKIMRLENLVIPEGFDFESVAGLTIESRQKLKRYSPRTIAQASRIPGVSPADISVLLVYFGR